MTCTFRPSIPSYGEPTGSHYEEQHVCDDTAPGKIQKRRQACDYARDRRDRIPSNHQSIVAVVMDGVNIVACVEPLLLLDGPDQVAFSEAVLPT